MKKDTQKLLGLAVLGLGAWYLFGRSAKPASAPAATDTFGAPSRPFGDPANVSSVAHACNAAWRLGAVGQTKPAASWASVCTAGGGTVPTDAAHQYT